MFWEGLSFGLGLGVAGLVVYMLIAILPGEKYPRDKNKYTRYWK